MTGWTLAPLADVATILRQTVEPTEIEVGTAYVGLENIERGGALVNVKTVGDADLASTKFRFTREHVLFGKLRPYLAKIARPNFSGVCSTDILPIVPGKQLCRDYLAHFLAQPRIVTLAASRATGANLPRLSPGELAKFQIPLPTVEEQRRIAGVLDRAYELHAKRRQTIARLADLTQSIFLDLFGDPLRNPMNWTRIALGAIIEAGPQNGLYKPAGAYGEGAPIVRIDSFYDGVISELPTLKRVRIDSDEQSSYGLTADDILINRVNSPEYLGKCALVPPLVEPTVFESNMMRFRVNRQLIIPQYLVQFLQTAYIKSQIQNAAKHAVNQSSINQKDVTSFMINLPPIARQQMFVERAAAVERLKATHRASLVELDALFASLQDRAFKGLL